MLLTGLNSAIAALSPFALSRETAQSAPLAEPRKDGNDAGANRVRESAGQRDRVELSLQAREASQRTQATQTAPPDPTVSRADSNGDGSGHPAKADNASQAAKPRTANGEPLNDEQTKQLEKLKQRDREVHTHEQAHKNTAGPYARGGAQFDYQQGPDGKRYAVGGHVNIDTSPVRGDPQATIQKMQVVRRAALAPADPSSQDRQVAAQASQTIAQAQQELRQQRTEPGSPGSSDPPENNSESSRNPRSDAAIASFTTAHDTSNETVGSLIDLIG